MQTPSRSRIAWFLRLQRILVFPKHFLAPQAGTYRSPELVGDEAGPVQRRDLGPVTHPAAEVSPVRRAVPDHLALRPLNKSMALSSSSTARAITAASAGRAVKRPMFQNVYRIAPGRRSPVTMNSAFTSMAAGSKHDYLRAIWGPTPDHAGSSIRTEIQTRISFADTLPISRSIRNNQPQQSAAERTFISRSPETTLRAPPPPSTGDARSEQTSVLNRRPFSGGPPPDLGRSLHRQEIRGGASTVHLDGATLGQWAIQHLERVLAKPSAGMTGVDPRASLPRGRVSPF
jgi:hypothetical protein